MEKTAVVIGATGLTGGLLVKELLNDNRYDQIHIITRRRTGFEDPKIVEHIVDLLNYSTWKEFVIGDDLFCCIGTTRKKTPNLDDYRKIDFGIPYHAAKYSKANGLKTFSVVSAIGANSSSSIFYNKLKGEMEEAVLAEGPSHVYVMRPSIIGGSREESRFLEGLGLGIFKVLGFLMVGKLKKYRMIQATDIAKGMIAAANSQEGSRVYESDQIVELAEHAYIKE